MNKTMTQIEITEFGGPDVLKPQIAPIPSPAALEVVIKVHAAGINRPDVMQRQGKYPMPEGVNPIPGLEVSGEIVSLGENVSGWEIGDFVCALTEGGGYAEYCAVPAGQILPIPKGYTFEQAACLPETFFTIYANLIQIGELKPGQRVLIHGGTSGIGTTALSLCKALGVEAFATARGTEKCEAIRDLGGIPIDYQKQTFSDVIQEKTNGEGVDVILDIVGGSYFNDNILSLKQGGRLVIIGFMGGTHASEVDLMKLVLKRAVVTGSTMRSRNTEDKSKIAHGLRQDVWDLLSNGLCPPPIISNRFKLTEANLAHAEMEQSNHIGKLVLAIGNL